MARIETRHLTLARGGKTLCADLNVAFNAGENWVILGANGSGKTTLLHTLAGLFPPTRGEVLLDGQPIGAYPARARAKLVGVLFQDEEAVFPATALDTVLTGRHPHMRRFAWANETERQHAYTALARVDLAGFGARDLNSLSGGERRRVEIAALLAQETSICLLDEPTPQLDLRHHRDILALFQTRVLAAPERNLNVFVLHDLNAAARIGCQALLLFGDGEWRAGPAADMLQPAWLERVYGCSVRKITDGEHHLFVAY